MEYCAVYGPVTQGEFLQRLGIGPRAAVLQQNADAAQGEAIDAAVRRLTAAAEMGELFKGLAFAGAGIRPAGV